MLFLILFIKILLSFKLIFTILKTLLYSLLHLFRATPLYSHINLLVSIVSLEELLNFYGENLSYPLLLISELELLAYIPGTFLH